MGYELKSYTVDAILCANASSGANIDAANTNKTADSDNNNFFMILSLDKNKYAVQILYFYSYTVFNREVTIRRTASACLGAEL